MAWDNWLKKKLDTFIKAIYALRKRFRDAFVWGDPEEGYPYVVVKVLVYVFLCLTIVASLVAFFIVFDFMDRGGEAVFYFVVFAGFGITIFVPLLIAKALSFLRERRRKKNIDSNIR
jgi:hypothetical protein